MQTSTVVRTQTDRTVTSSVYTTLTRSAYCHFPTSKTTTAKWPPWPPATANNAARKGDATDVPDAPLPTQAPEPPTDFAPLAATTITVTETTYTVTLTSVTTLPAATTTETSVGTNTMTM
ncbi:hypothetical protein PG994_004463 [Apiospora phragmitis]|uniref:Uncharacterized protein n=1 Tax=Apiospora phragmitis TaxID=2905665 RepID=A0ABR1VUI3_9PEZI